MHCFEEKNKVVPNQNINKPLYDLFDKKKKEFANIQISLSMTYLNKLNKKKDISLLKTKMGFSKFDNPQRAWLFKDQRSGLVI